MDDKEVQLHSKKYYTRITASEKNPSLPVYEIDIEDQDGTTQHSYTVIDIATRYIIKLK